MKLKRYFDLMNSKGNTKFLWKWTWTYSRLLFTLTVLPYYPFNPLKRAPILNHFSLVIEITRSIIISLFLKVKQKTQSDNEGGLRRILWKQMLQGVHWRLGTVRKPSGKKKSSGWSYRPWRALTELSVLFISQTQ